MCRKNVHIQTVMSLSASGQTTGMVGSGDPEMHTYHVTTPRSLPSQPMPEKSQDMKEGLAYDAFKFQADMVKSNTD